MEQRSQVEYFGQALLELGATNPDLVVLDVDVSASTKTTFFGERYPERFIQVGISEQDVIGVAAGLAASGKVPVAAGFATFIAGRGWEQIMNTVARQRLNVKIVATHSGLSPAADGESHQSIGDIALMRVLPGMKVVVPADASAAASATRSLIADRGPSYLRLVRGSTPIVYPDEHELKIGESEALRDGSDVTLVACGVMVPKALNAAETLKEEGVIAGVLDMHTLKPLDEEAMIRSARETGAIVTAEEHSIIGGLGSAVAEVLAENHPTPLRRVGIRDRFGESSRSYSELQEAMGLTPQAIVEAAHAAMKMKE